MSAFDDALATLPPPLRALIEAQLACWGAHAEWHQIGINLRTECALPPDQFQSLLANFAAALQTAPSPLPEARWDSTWCTVCKPHELRGAPVAPEARPAVLGRAWSVGGFARSLSQTHGDLPHVAAERLIRRHAGASPPAHAAALIRATALGRDVIWATFHPGDSTRDPFSPIPAQAEAIACALGLGYHRGEIVVFIYSTTLPLYRPTIADANTYSYYRPHHDPTAYHGYTRPLRSGVTPMPEVVHAVVTGEALVSPYRIVA